MKNLLLFLVSILAITSCTSVQIDSFTDPDYRDKSFQNILLEIDGVNFGQQKELEINLYNKIAYYKIEPEISSMLFLPTRSYDSTQKAKILLDKNIEAILKINILNAGYQPEKMGEQIIEKPYLLMKAILFDAKNDRIAWFGDIYSSGNAMISVNGLANEAFSKLADRLAKQKVIIPNK